MSDAHDPAGGQELQFDRVSSGPTSSAPASTLAATCVACQTSIETEYYAVNGHVLCDRCRAAAESTAETPRGIVPFLTAGAFGLGAGIVGAVIYYAVMAIANLEIGIVAILIGYMVGYSVRKGARGRGGRRFQVLAVALTYASIALAYTPIAVKQAMDDERSAQKTAATSSNSSAAAPTDSGRTATTTPGGGLSLMEFAVMFGLIAALPVLVVTGSLPYGLISALIILIGMRQAWMMTGAPRLQVFGPYRVGAARPSTPAA
jgi:hypothetical protein